nr:hypothetical protein [Gemmatimonadaceae bacterium]
MHQGQLTLKLVPGSDKRADLRVTNPQFHEKAVAKDPPKPHRHADETNAVTVVRRMSDLLPTFVREVSELWNRRDDRGSGGAGTVDD